MKIIEKTLDRNINKIKIIPLSDLHLADKSSNKQLFKQAIEEIKNDPNTYTILNGDLLDSCIKDSVGNIYDSDMKPMNEVEEIINMLEPIRDKILVIAPGNHEQRIYKQCGIDITKIVAMQLDILDRYAPAMWYLFLQFGINPRNNRQQLQYCLTGLHGSGSGGKKAGSALNKVTDLQNVALADIYITSHFHKPASTKSSIFIADEQHHNIKKKDMYFLVTNSFLELEDSYAEAWGVPPSNTSLCYVTLDGTKKHINITI